MEPFLFPVAKIKRKHIPPQYNNYKLYRKYLKAEFGNKCAYCMLPDGIPGNQYFEIDHYKPKNKFPSLITEYTNLFYSCRNCNNSKRDYLPSDEEINQGLLILNPCDNVMIKHVKYNGVKIDTKTIKGNFTVDVLRLNDEEIIKYRQWIVDSIDLYKKELINLTKTKEECEKQLLNKKRFKKKLEKKLQQLNIDIEKIEVYIKKHTGKI